MSWTAEEDALLGTDTDRAIAAKTGRSLDMVFIRRQRLKIPHDSAYPPRWKPDEDRLLGTAPDKEIADRLNRSEAAVIASRQHLRIRKFLEK